jgi:hypothetical protein
MQENLSALYESVQPFIPAIKQAYTLYQVIEKKPTLQYNPEIVEKQRKYVEEARLRLGLTENARPPTSLESADDFDTIAALSDSARPLQTMSAPTNITSGPQQPPSNFSTSGVASGGSSSSVNATETIASTANIGNALQAAMFMDPAFMRMIMEQPVVPSSTSAPSSGAIGANVNASDFYGVETTRMVGRQQVGVEPVLSYKDQQVFMARMSQLFASLKQLISMYEQERMNWMVSMDQITREIAFITTLLRQDPHMMGSSLGVTNRRDRDHMNRVPLVSDMQFPENEPHVGGHPDVPHAALPTLGVHSHINSSVHARDAVAHHEAELGGSARTHV